MIMKKILFAFWAFILAFVSCGKSDQDKAENLARDLILKIDPSTDVRYVKFGALEKATIDYELTYPAYLIREEIRNHTEVMRKHKERIDHLENTNHLFVADNIKEIQRHAEIIRQLNDSFNIESSRFAPDTTRYMMRAIFEPSSSKEKLKTESVWFYFNKELTRIVGIMGTMDKSGKEALYMEYEYPPSPLNH